MTAPTTAFPATSPGRFGPYGGRFVPETLMERVFGDGEIRVNSMHHMAVDELAAGLKISARSPDGVVEAFESAMDDWWILGTQFHPEADSASALAELRTLA